MDTYAGLVLLVLFSVVLFVTGGRFLWNRFRLRRAFFIVRQQILWSLKFAPRKKLVLDVGAGNNPHIRADILCEKYLYDDFHRGAGGAATDLPLVVGDAGALPFKSDCIDVMISSNTIEHLDDPAGFFHEAGRVAQSGFFTAPSALQEHLCSYIYHPWMIDQEGDTLIFQAKDRVVVNPRVHEFFSNHIMNNNIGLDTFTIDHWNELVIDYQWQEKPRIEVRGEPFTPEVKASTRPEEAAAIHILQGSERFRAGLKLLARRIIHRLISAHQNVNLADILACPCCQGSVSITSAVVHCPQCNLDYPIKAGIPFMLLDHAMPSGLDGK
jgi:uncharacterized protein YbaR (Trm112 family)/SAM-dependent methyltransferase